MTAYTAKQANATGRADLVVKLLAYALDPAAGEGEAINAAARMVTVAKREAITFPALVRHIAPPAVREPEPPPGCELRMPWGRHKGERLGDIVRGDPGYVEWVANTIDDSYIAEAAAEALSWYESRRAK